MLDLRRLQILTALEVKGTMTAAAQALFMTTSAVSQQLSLLEKEVGVPLIMRLGRQVQLTEAGLVLVRHANQIVVATEEAETSMKRFRTDVKGTVKVSAFPSFSAAVLPRALVTLSQNYPDLSVTISDFEPLQSIAQLRAGQIDIAIIDDVQPVATKGLIQMVLCQDEIVLCLSTSYADVPPGELKISSLRDANWILDSKQSVFELFVRKLCAEQGFEPKVIANCSNLAVTMAMVEAGCGVAVLSRMHVMRKAFGIVIRSMAPACKRNVILAHRIATQDSPIVAAVVAELKEITHGWSQ